MKADLRNGVLVEVVQIDADKDGTPIIILHAARAAAKTAARHLYNKMMLVPIEGDCPK